MTLLEQAKKKYPLGTKFYATNKDTIKGMNSEIVGSYFDWWINDKYKKGEAIKEQNSGGIVYYKGKLAEIISYPEGYKKEIIYELY